MPPSNLRQSPFCTPIQIGHLSTEIGMGRDGTVGVDYDFNGRRVILRNGELLLLKRGCDARPWFVPARLGRRWSARPWRAERCAWSPLGTIAGIAGQAERIESELSAEGGDFEGCDRRRPYCAAFADIGREVGDLAFLDRCRLRGCLLATHLRDSLSPLQRRNEFEAAIVHFES